MVTNRMEQCILCHRTIINGDIERAVKYGPLYFCKQCLPGIARGFGIPEDMIAEGQRIDEERAK